MEPEGLRISEQVEAVDEKHAFTAEQFCAAHGLGLDFPSQALALARSRGRPVPVELPSWPPDLKGATQKSISGSSDLREAARRLVGQFKLVNAQIVKTTYMTAVAPDLERINDRTDFGRLSAAPVLEAIENGRSAMVSRVLETNIEFLIARTQASLEVAQARGLRPALEIQLSAPDMLVEIARQETRMIASRGTKLGEHRGTSYSDVLMALRHLTLWCGTMRALAEQKTRYSDALTVFVRRGLPDERGNWAEAPHGEAAYCVGLREWELGLDAGYYEIADPDLVRRFHSQAREGRSNGLDARSIRLLIEKAGDIEAGLRQQVVSGASVGPVLQDALKGSSVLASAGSNDVTVAGWFLALPSSPDLGERIVRAQRELDDAVLPAVRHRLNA